MKFEDFYQKYFKEEKGDFYTFSKEGFLRMRKSVDALHDNVHIENLYGLLDKFLIKHKKIKNKLDLKAVFLSLSWHDTWKAKRNPNNVFVIIYNQMVEGLMASRLFNKEAKKYNIDKSTIQKAAYAIRKHSSLQFLKRKNLESKVLKDIDKIDSVNFQRFLYAKNKNFRFHKKRHLFLIHLYISKISRDAYNFAWTKDFLKKERKNFIVRFNSEIRHPK